MPARRRGARTIWIALCPMLFVTVILVQIVLALVGVLADHLSPRARGDRLRPQLSDHNFCGGARMIKRTLGCVVLCGLMASVSLQAHHSLAGVYDMKKDMELSGAVESVKF